MKYKLLWLLVLLWFGGNLCAQEAVRFGSRQVYLEKNVLRSTRGTIKTSSLELGLPASEQVIVLLQLENETIDRQALTKKGVVLGDYLGSNAYYASVPAGSRPSDFVGSGLYAITSIRGEWKLPTAFVLGGVLPEWVQVGSKLKMTAIWFENVAWEYVEALLKTRGIEYGVPSLAFHSVPITATREEILALAEDQALAYLQWSEPPRILYNRGAAQLSGGNVLRLPNDLGGRGLTGKGVKVGLWDANVADHIDYGKRIHRVEFEEPFPDDSPHGMHVCGTVAGGGYLDEQAMGIAPEAEVWTSNFERQANGLVAAQEMLNLHKSVGITLTQNSYGEDLNRHCVNREFFSYSYFHIQTSDIVTYLAPTLTHVYALGNEQQKCGLLYGSVSNVMKNVISVGATNVFGKISSYSSFGPSDDGRILPTITARGSNVLSTANKQGYMRLDGTSMACPTVTGHLALLTQRFRQLNGGATPLNYFMKALVANTARDAGRPGPDYEYGFGILDAVAAAEVIEGNWYKTGTIQQGKQEVQITVPEGVKQLRVMIAWNDPVVRKEYQHGESPLINDLDLSVSCGGNTVLPWILKKEKPQENAVRGVNSVDNIEQVTIENPTAGMATIAVTAKSIKSNPSQQDYAIVWYFDYQRPEIFSPLAEDICAPGEIIYLRVENMKAPLRVEISTDEGRTYTVLGEHYPLHAGIEIPKGMKATDRVHLRVTDQDGVVLKSKNFFVMPRVMNLHLADKYCERTGWELTWNGTAEAEKYEVVRLDLNTEKFVPIATVTESRYTLKPEDIKDERNVYAVYPIHKNHWRGKRSMAVISYQPAPLHLTAAQLPFFDAFVGYPFRYVRTTAPSGIKLDIANSAPGIGLEMGAQTLRFSCGKTATADWSDPFKVDTHRASLEVCTMDLSAIPAKTPLQFIVYGSLNYAFDGKPEDSQLRLLVNGEELPDVKGRKHILADNLEHTYTWDITEYAGSKIKITLEAALRDFDCTLLLLYYDLTKKLTYPEVLLRELTEVAPKVAMGQEQLSFIIRNNSSIPLPEVPVSVEVDGNLVFSNTEKDLAPFEDRVVTCTADFSTDEPQGKKFKVVARVDAQEDTDKNNNWKSIEVYNMGQVLIMPPVRYAFFNGQWYDIPKHDSIRIQGGARFVDMGGELANYKEKENAVYKILPQNPNHTIQVRFEEWDFGPGDVLDLFTEDVPWALENLLKEDMKDKYSHRLTGEGKDRIFVSQAQDGSITFRQLSTGNKPGTGWKADIREVEIPNQWRILALQEVEGKDAQHKRIEATIENLTSVDLNNVALQWIVDGVLQQIRIPKLPAKKGAEASLTKFVFDTEFDITPPVRHEIAVRLLRDGNLEDNYKTYTLLRDTYWPDGEILDPKKLYIKELSGLTIEPLVCVPSEHVQYRVDEKIPIYLKSPNHFVAKLSNSTMTELKDTKIRVWIDFDPTDKQLKDQAPELTLTPCKAYAATQKGILDYRGVQGLKPGLYRMRMMLARDADYELFKAGKGIAFGQVVEFTADVKDEYHPADNDLEVLEESLLRSGTSLTTAQKMKVKVRNNGYTTFETVALTYQVDGGSKSAPKEFANKVEAGKTVELEWDDVNIDLSTPGKHEIKISLATQNTNPANDVLTKTVYNVEPSTNKLYALQFKAHEERQGVEIPKLLTGEESELTIEGWWRCDDYHTHFLFDAEGLKLRVVYNIPSYKDGSLLVFSGKSQFNISELPAINRGQWHHIAVSVRQEEDLDFGFEYTAVRAFVDGIEISLQQGENSPYSATDVTVSRRLGGQMAMFRIWEKEVESAQLLANRYKSVRKSDGSLEKDCIAEFLPAVGKGSFITSGSDFVGEIRSKDPEHCWKPMERLVVKVEGANSVEPSQYDASGKNINLVIPATTTDLTKVKLNFISEWGSNVVVTRKNETNPLTSETELDFSANKMLEFKATLNLFGKTAEQEFAVTLVTEKSKACDLKKFEMLKTDGSLLKNLDNPNQDLQISLTAEESTEVVFDKVKVKLKELSAGATLYYNDEKIEKETVREFDLREPKILRVVAEDGHTTKIYTLGLSIEQKITWTPSFPSEGIVYTKDPLELNAVATSKLPCKYHSLDSKIATIDADGRLRTVGVGTTTIVATQEGNGLYSAALPVQHQIKVLPRTLVVRMKDATMALGESLPLFQFEYEGLQYAGTESLFAREYLVQQDATTIWTPQMPPLAKGSYTVVPRGYTTPEQIGGYKVEYQQGLLTVTDPKTAREVEVTIVDEAKKPLEGVLLHCQNIIYKSSAEGIVKLYLKAGTYVFTVGKDGYASNGREFEVKDKNLRLMVPLAKLAHKIIYSTDGKGSILGLAEQKVPSGHSGLRVTAVPKSQNYKFSKWSDGKTSASRTEDNVTQDIELTAEFVENKYSVTYLIAGEVDGGEFVTDASTQKQQVGFAQDAAPVEVRAKEGYVFLCWSDGQLTMRRQDKNIRDHEEVHAIFMRPVALPWRENFDMGLERLKYWYLENPDQGIGWVLRPENRIHKVHSGYGYVLMVDPKSEELYYTARVLSPWISLANRQVGKDLEISFDHWFGNETFSPEVKGILEYQFDGETNWTTFKEASQDVVFTSSVVKQQVRLALTDAELTSKKTIRYRWTFKNDKFSAWWALDNIRVGNPAPTTFSLTYNADANGFVKKNNEAPTSEIKLENLDASNKTVVSAVPKETIEDELQITESRFVQWLPDGLTNSQRVDTQEPIATTLSAVFKKRLLYKRYYNAGEHGRVEGLTYQTVESGQETQNVLAVPESSYWFDRWDDGVLDNPRTDVNITKGAKVTALFKDHHLVEFEAPKNGELEVLWNGKKLQSGGDNVREKEYTLKITATPADGAKLEELTLNGEEISSGMLFKLRTDAVIVAKFSKSDEVETADLLTDVVVSPNPFADLLRISNVVVADANFELLTLQGLVVRRGALEIGETVIETHSIEAGVYLLRIFTEDGTSRSYRVVKSAGA